MTNQSGAANEWAAVKGGLDKVTAFIKAAQANPVVESLEQKFPGFGREAAALTGFLPGIAEAEQGIDLLMAFGPALFDFIHAAGIKPMDAADPAYLEREKELEG